MGSMRTILFQVSAVSAYVALFYKLFQVRHGWRESIYRTLLATLTLQCWTFTMGAIALSSETFLGVRNLAILFMHVSAVMYCVAAEILLLQWLLSPDAVRKRIAVWLSGGVITVGVLSVMFFVAGGSSRPRDDFTTGSDDPLLLAYLLLFIASQAVPCVTILRQCFSRARQIDQTWMRRALRILGAAAIFLSLYCATRTLNILSPLFEADLGAWTILPSIFSSIGIVLLAIGITIPSWGSQLAAVPRWLRDLRAYRDLHPLWMDLRKFAPDIVLEEPGGSVRDLRFRLHRRVIEIRDGWRALGPYFEKARIEAGAGIPRASSNDAVEAALEAARIRQALRAKEQGATPDHSRVPDRFAGRDVETQDEEVAWLGRSPTPTQNLADRRSTNPDRTRCGDDSSRDLIHSRTQSE